MKQLDPQQIFEELAAGLPLFEDGRINYTHAKKAPVINVIVHHDGEILIVQRSHKVSNYQGLWNGISGFIDTPKPIHEFARQELREELALHDQRIHTITVCHPYEVVDASIDRTWVVYPTLAHLAVRPDIVLDWEHTDYAWIPPHHVAQYSHVPDFDKSVKLALMHL